MAVAVARLAGSQDWSVQSQVGEEGQGAGTGGCSLSGLASVQGGVRVKPEAGNGGGQEAAGSQRCFMGLGWGWGGLKSGVNANSPGS